MKNRINWDLVIVGAFGAAAVGVLVWALVNGVGMKPMDGLRLVLYNTKMTLIP